MRRTVITAVVACLLGAATVGAVGTAATKKGSSRQSQTTQTGTTPTTPPPTLKEEMAKRDAARDAHLGKVADDLDVSLSDLKAALDAVRDDRLAADVKADRLTQAQADAIKACVAAPLTCDRSNLPAFGGFRHGHRPGGPGHDRAAFFAAVAQKLGKTTAEVKKAFQDNRPARAPGMRRGHGPMGHGPGGRGPRGPGGPAGPGPMMGPGPGMGY